MQEPSSFGKLYNWYALNDSRGFGIEGFKIPTIEDWSSLTKYGSKALKSKTGWMILTDITYTGCQCKGYNCNGNNSTGLNIKGSGYRNYIGIWEDYASFYEDYERAVFWVDSNKDNSIKEITIKGEKIIIETGANIFGIDGFEDNYWGIDSDGITAKGDGVAVSPNIRQEGAGANSMAETNRLLRAALSRPAPTVNLDSIEIGTVAGLSAFPIQ